MQGMLQLLRLIDSLDKVEGRKKLQKIVYILKARGHDFPQHFGYLHYGPFSSEVAAEIDSLVSGDLIDERGEGQPYKAYVYTAQDSARALLKELRQSTEPEWKDFATALNQKNVSDLEAMSTILYLQANGFTGQSLKTRFIELKPTLKGLFDRTLREVGKLPKKNA
jgi:hypothetical protein